MERELSASSVTKVSRKGMAPFPWLPSTLDCWIYAIDVFQESLFMGLLLDDKDVIVIH